MVDPGASSEEIETEVFSEFESNLEDSDINDNIEHLVWEEMTSDDCPHEFSETLIEEVIESNED